MNNEILLFIIFRNVISIFLPRDDDVCVSGEATPRMKVKFKSADGRVATLDSLY